MKKYIYLLYFFSAATLNAQILKDSASINLLKRGVDDIYDFRFEAAKEVREQLTLSYPNHPVIYLFSGMITYWENYPLVPDSPASSSYEKDMITCIKICEEKQNPGDYAEYLLANLGARGMLLMYYADNDLSGKVTPLVISTYRHVREAFDYSSAYPDFSFFTGLYNYYREAYPEAHPIYKVLAVLFPRGDKVKGIIEMRKAATTSIMLKAEAYSFLLYIFMNFENNYKESLPYTQALHDLYPDNPAYLAWYIKNLLLVKRYDEAENLLISCNDKITNPYFIAEKAVFNGILQEKKYHNYNQALKYYNSAISDLSDFGYYGNDYTSYAYFGLSRISGYKNDKQNRRTFRKMALELTHYKRLNFDD